MRIELDAVTGERRWMWRDRLRLAWRVLRGAEIVHHSTPYLRGALAARINTLPLPPDKLWHVERLPNVYVPTIRVAVTPMDRGREDVVLAPVVTRETFYPREYVTVIRYVVR